MTDDRAPGQMRKVAFEDLPGWADDNHLEAYKSLLRFCDLQESTSARPSALRLDAKALKAVCSDHADAEIADDVTARKYFERGFEPHQVTDPGFLTGYYEPEVPASRERTRTHSVPLHGKPKGLETVAPADRPAGWPEHLSHGRRVDGMLTEMPDRGAIMDGALDGEALEIAWLQDPVDAYFIHVQGSARLKMTDGSVMRVGYAGKTGHPYTGIGRLLVDRGEGTPEDFTMTGLRKWLSDHPEQRALLFRENRSYIFFREVTGTTPDEGPVGAAGLPLTPGRSLAVDADFLPYGALVFVTSDFPDPDGGEGGFSRLMVADDTGSAINGAARGDIFVGSGDDAGRIAGDIRHRGTFTVLVPRPAASGQPAD